MKAAESLIQKVCPHCEELVHRYAASCPYCQKDIVHASLEEKASTSNNPFADVHTKSFGKIEALPNIGMPECEKREEPLQQEQALDGAFIQQAGHVLLSLFSLLAGSFFFFFGLLLVLFSENGTFSLEWKASSWPYFIFSAMFLLLTGLWSVSKIEK
jgi:hypothetical protein